MADESQFLICIADDDDDIRFALNLLLTQKGYRVIEAETPDRCLQLLEHKHPDLILMDMNYSRDTTSGLEGLNLLKSVVKLQVPVILMTAWANIELVVQGMQLGANDFIEKPWNKAKLLHSINEALTQNRSVEELPWVANSQVMESLDRLIEQVAPTDASLLILGENGTGKSELAKRIHNKSRRAAHQFVSLNMAAIPDTLFESELFGHKKGAFTDAKTEKQGAFKVADKSTLFMDEIGALPTNLQPKLLQVLESGSFSMLGGNIAEQVDVRVIAATNQDLIQGIADKTFRQDLYYRLNTFIIHIPPLRERLADILPLAQSFIENFADKYHKSQLSLSMSAKEKLQGYSWPGNVRELRQTIERAVIINRSRIIDSAELLLQPMQTKEGQDISQMTLEQLEERQVKQALLRHQGSISASAQALGISRNALYRRIEKYQLDVSGNE
jgi:DNA-binding NtrC family response regulator